MAALDHIHHTSLTYLDGDVREVCVLGEDLVPEPARQVEACEGWYRARGPRLGGAQQQDRGAHPRARQQVTTLGLLMLPSAPLFPLVC